MVEKLLLVLSLLLLVGAVLCIMFPKAVVGLSGALNRTLGSIDESLMRYRYVLGALLAVVSYGVFYLALLTMQMD